MSKTSVWPNFWIHTVRAFDERSTAVWFFTAGFALILAAVGLSVASGRALSGAHLFASLIAFAVSVLSPWRVPRGSLTVWVFAVAAIWLSPLGALDAQDQRFVFAAAILVSSLVYQGNRRFFPLLVIGLLAAGSIGIGSFNLARDLSSLDFNLAIRDDSLLTFSGTLFLAALIFSGRVAFSHAVEFQTSLRTARESLERVRIQVGTSNEAVHLARERLWGRTRLENSTGDLSRGRPASDIFFPELELSQTPFVQIVTRLRKVFSDFQSEGRAEGRISGPIRFVFFAPAAGYDGEAIVAADLDTLEKGVTACLDLALESLPEIGRRKREGVIRLSIRYGVRTIEIAVEDNGRGLASPNKKVEEEFHAIKELTAKWNGKLDRMARLGVGSRTALELRIIGTSTAISAMPVTQFQLSDGPHA